MEDTVTDFSEKPTLSQSEITLITGSATTVDEPLGRAWHAGEILEGVYRVERVLAQGGMGIVYLATDTSSNTLVVIKTPLDHIVGMEEFKKRFFREAEEWVRLGWHPNIVRAQTVLDIQHLPRLVLEYIDGQSLLDVLKQSPLTQDKSLFIALGIVRGMQFSHEQGIVHRDLKPANIMITKNGIAKITDFGLVKRIMELHHKQSENTTDKPNAPDPSLQAGLTHGIMGTPEYMSPEQWKGTTQTSTDIYAFGIILFEMLTGRLPFDFSHLKGMKRITAYQTAHRTETPLLPDAASAELPQALQSIIYQCLEKKTKNRFASFADVETALFAAADNLSLPLPESPETQTMVQQRQIDKAYAYLRLGKMTLFRGDSEKAQSLIDDASTIVNATSDNKLSINLMLQQAAMKLHGGQLDAAHQILTIALQTSEAIQNSALRIQTISNLGITCDLLGQLDTSIEYYRKGLTLAESQEDKTSTLRLWNNLAIVLSRQGNQKESCQLYRNCIQLGKELEHWNVVAASSLNLGVEIKNAGQLQEADILFQEAEHYAKLIGKHKTVGLAKVNHALLHMAWKDTDKALQGFQDALHLFQTSKYTEGQIISLVNLSGVYLETEIFGQALSCAQEALQMAEASKLREGISNALQQLADIKLTLKEYKAAATYLNKCINVQTKMNLMDRVLYSQTQLAICQHHLGNKDKARSLSQEIEANSPTQDDTLQALQTLKQLTKKSKR